MKAKSSIIAAAVFVCGIAGALVYANIDALTSALGTANAHVHGSSASAASASDHLGCHRHGPVAYHCH